MIVLCDKLRKDFKLYKSDLAWIVGRRERSDDSRLLVQAEKDFEAPSPPTLALTVYGQLGKVAVSIMDGMPQEVLHVCACIALVGLIPQVMHAVMMELL